MSDDFLAPPPFAADTALATLRRSLRELKLAERAGAFEFAGHPVVKARAEEAVLRLEIARRPSRSPDWERVEVRDHSQLRRFADDLKKRLARWADGDE